MAYKVVADFKDLRDDGHEYKAGDVYPHTGEADEQRAKHLMTPTDQRGALIAKVSEEVPPAPTPAPSRRKKKE